MMEFSSSPMSGAMSVYFSASWSSTRDHSFTAMASFTAYDVVPMTGAPLAGGRFQGASAQELKISEEDAHLAGCVRRRAEAVANFGDLLELPRKPRELLFSC